MTHVRLGPAWLGLRRQVAVPLRTAPRVFISYAHDSPAHRTAVGRLGRLLTMAGVDVRMDQLVEGRVAEWPHWVEREVRTADVIIVVASADYRRRADDEQEPDGTGRGVIWEAASIRELLYADRPGRRERVLPLLLPGGRTEDIPFFLGPAGGHRVVVPELTTAGVRELVQLLFERQPDV